MTPHLQPIADTALAVVTVMAALWALGRGRGNCSCVDLGWAANFQARPRNAGRVWDTGLWSRSRHPNYFFESGIWVGFALVALGSPWGTLALLTAALVLHLRGAS